MEPSRMKVCLVLLLCTVWVYGHPRRDAKVNDVSGNNVKKSLSGQYEEDVLKKLVQTLMSFRDQSKRDDTHTDTSDTEENDPNSNANQEAHCSEDRNSVLQNSFEVIQNGKIMRSKCGRKIEDTYFPDSLKLTPEQKAASKHMEKRGFWEEGIRKWIPYEGQPTVPYVIDFGYTNEQKEIIETSIQNLRGQTCVDFLPKTDELLNKLRFNNYLNITTRSNSYGCWSYLGRVYNRQQELGIRAPGCVTERIVIHELLHALGLDHRQSRDDRDNYLRMNWQYYLYAPDSGNLKLENTVNYSPFDVSSVLQYAPSVLSKNGRNTMSSLIPELEPLFGIATSVNFYDVMAITAGYDCTAHCSSKPSCDNGGFVDHKCECRCPDKITGPTCTELETDSGCGGILDISNGIERIIRSQNYPGQYPFGSSCLWLAKTSKGRHIKTVLRKMNLPFDSERECLDYLQLRFNLLGQPGRSLCGSIQTDEHVYYTTPAELPNIMYINFESKAREEGILKRSTEGTWNFELTVLSVLPCASNPCENGGTCKNGESTYECTCATNWKGISCNIPEYPCQLDPCENGGTCTNDGLTFTCNCTTEWTGTVCDIEVTPCTYKPCKNRGRCIIEGEGYRCKCKEDWIGPTCELKELPCSSSPCKNSGVCTDSGTSFLCDCSDSWKGDTCEEPVLPCDSTPCKNNGVCANTDEGFSCTCSADWKGDTCNEEALPCDSSPCKNGGTCVNDGDAFTCTCLDGWKGDTCVEPVGTCDSSPCKNNGFCTENGESFVCNCPVSWKGATCEEAVQPCDSSPCKNNGNCANAGDSFTCTCSAGWKGDTCDEEDFPCDHSPCKHGGICTNNGARFTCACTSAWKGETCEQPAMFRQCTFTYKSSPCFLRNIKKDFFDWNLAKKGAGTNMKYALAPSRRKRFGKSAVICSTESFPDLDYCLVFDYRLKKDVGEVLEVSVNDITIFRTRRENPREWHYYASNVHLESDKKICLNATMSDQKGSGIIIDNVTLTSGKCQCSQRICLNGGVCQPDIEKGFKCHCLEGFNGMRCEIKDSCGFDIERENCFLWDKVTDDTTGWSTQDVSQDYPDPFYLKYAANGDRYLYMESADLEDKQKAILEAPHGILPEGPYCLTFAHFLIGDDGASAEFVVTVDGVATSRIDGSAASDWQYKHVDVNLKNKMELSTLVSGPGVIGIDDISVHPGTCDV